MLKRGDLVLVQWEDIHDFAGEDWNDDPSAYPTASISSLGWVAFPFTRKHTTFHLSRDWDEDEDKPRSVIAIPAGCITSIVAMTAGSELWDRGKQAN